MDDFQPQEISEADSEDWLDDIDVQEVIMPDSNALRDRQLAAM